MTNNNAPTHVMCPLVDERIDICDCMENQDIKEAYIPSRYKQKPGWQEICKNCDSPYHS